MRSSRQTYAALGLRLTHMLRFVGFSMLLHIVIPGRSVAAAPSDYQVAYGWFYTQTSGRAGLGYAVTNRRGIPFWDFFQAQGGVARLGYPISRRWTEGPATYQAFQKAVLQWLPGRGMAYLNIYDKLSAAGLDDWLDQAKNVPKPQEFPEDVGASFSQAVENHLALLDQNPEIKAKWYEQDGGMEVPWTENPFWFRAYGLPISYEDRGDVRVLRAQRAAFQQWMIPTSFTTVGGVVTSNGGEHIKEAGLIPEPALAPQPPPPLKESIVYISNRDGDWELYLLTLDGAEHVKLTDNSEDDYSPQWSPDGNTIVFASEQDRIPIRRPYGVVYAAEIYTVRADGSGLRRLTENSVPDAKPSFSPDGSLVAYICFSALCAMKADGSDQRALVQSPRVTPTARPAWSPNGQRIAFAGSQEWIAEGENGRVTCPLYIVPASGGTPVLVANDWDCEGVSWSPNSAELVFQSKADGDAELFVASIDGSGVRKLTDNEVVDHRPVWSPDGSLIAFVGSTPGSDAIYTVTPDGSNRRRLTTYSGSVNAPFSWSSDGKWIAHSIAFRPDLSQLAVVSADGSWSRQLTALWGRNEAPVPLP